MRPVIATIAVSTYLFRIYPVQDIVSEIFFKNVCHSQVILQAAVTVPRTSMMSFFYLCCGLPLLLFPAFIHLIIVFQPVRVIYVSVYTYINLDRSFNILYLIYFIKVIILIQRNQISCNFTFKYLYTNQISVFTGSFLK